MSFSLRVFIQVSVLHFNVVCDLSVPHPDELVYPPFIALQHAEKLYATTTHISFNQKAFLGIISAMKFLDAK